MNNQSPLVSVIIPVFRVEKYLEKGVSSIINQTYTNLQIILVDDGSDDNCPVICDEFEKKDERVLSLHKLNGGLSDARNYGLGFAEGKYIYFFDSDDYLEPNAIEKLVMTAENEDVDVVAFGYKKVDENDVVTEESHMKAGKYSFRSEKEKLDFISRVLCTYKVGWEAWNRLYRADIIKDNDLRFEPNKEVFSEDKCFNIYYTLCTNSLIFIDARLYHYLVRSDSIMGQVKKLKLNEILKLMDYTKQFALKKGFNYIGRKFYYINNALFYNLVRKIDKKDYKEYRAMWKCNDISKRFGTFIARPFIFTKILGVKAGLKELLRFERFLMSE